MTVALFATLSLGVSSCSDDDKYDPITEESIIGIWQTDWVTADKENPFLERLTWTFNADGTHTEVYESKEDDSVDTHAGTWSLSGNKLTITWNYDDEAEEYECYISGNTLKVVFCDYDDGSKYTVLMHRID